VGATDTMDGLRWWTLLALGSVLGCAESAPSEVPGSLAPSPCQVGEWLREDGLCAPAGLPPDAPCSPGEWLRDDGSCIPAGVPPDGCAEGFVHDGDRGCDPVLPASACAPGTIAVPGDTRCREIASCGTQTWGSIPAESTNEYVDGSYAGGNSDGTAAKPWTSILDAVNAAAPGAIVAIAAGSYAEDVVLQSKTLRLWGRCPSLVEIVGAGNALASLAIHTDATEVHALAVRGASYAIGVTGAESVILEDVWVHDTSSMGVFVTNQFGPTSVLIRNSLIDHTGNAGAAVWGAELSLERVSIRDNAAGAYGQGVTAQVDATLTEPSTLSITGSLVERIIDTGIYMEGSEATVEATVVSATLPDAQGAYGRALNARWSDDSLIPSRLTLRGSVIEQATETAVFVEGSEALIETTVVRDAQPLAEQTGRGLGVQENSMTAEPAHVTIQRSLLEGNRDTAILVDGSEAVVHATAVRETQLDVAEKFGVGIHAQSGTFSRRPAILTVDSSLVEANHLAGVVVFASTATMQSSVVRGTLPNAEGVAGRGLTVHPDPAPAAVTIRGSLFEQNREIGISLFGSETLIEASLVRETRHGSLTARGIDVESDYASGAPAQFTLRGTLFEHNEDVALAVFDSDARVEGCWARDGGLDGAGSARGFHVEGAPSTSATLTVRDSLLERHAMTSLSAVNGTLVLERCLISDTRPNEMGLLGDGIAVANNLPRPTNTITNTRIEQSARAAISNFGAEIAMSSCTLSCQAFDLAVEGGRYVDLGGNNCGCPAHDGSCQALSAGLAPPTAPPHAPPEPGP